MFPLLTETTPDLHIPGAPDWINMILPVVVPVITALLVWWFKLKRQEMLKRMQNADISRAEHLTLRMREFALMRASSFVERDFFRVARNILRDKEKGVEETSIYSRAHDELIRFGQVLLEEAKEYFDREDIDIVAELGEQRIEQIIDWAANRVSPFPGKPTVESLMDHGAEWFVERGAEWVRSQVTTHGKLASASQEKRTE